MHQRKIRRAEIGKQSETGESDNSRYESLQLCTLRQIVLGPMSQGRGGEDRVREFRRKGLSLSSCWRRPSQLYIELVLRDVFVNDTYMYIYAMMKIGGREAIHIDV